MRLDVYLATHWPETSRSAWQKHCKAGYVLVNGVPETSPRTILGEDDQVTVQLPEDPDFSTQDLPIIYEDEDVIVINKPAGVLTHAKGTASEEFTVAEFMRSRTTDGADTNRPGIVHRLDRGTSGLIITAKNPEAKRWLQKQFSNRKVIKTYEALVEGHPKQPNALITLPIERNPKKPQTFRVGANGKQAETAYSTTKRFGNATLLTLAPHTGRTHQLRVHMRHIGCPIVGDPFYGTAQPRLGRMFLHAASLELTLPSRQRKVFKAPLPAELQNYLKTLQ